ncbi:hypothetical protein SD70_29730 [Gordoniibacillus kamchatkensis]|uniref:Uncharacterized protein n=1 Tax=Gordoniibacillus kamchatkensis TaxID=1590651 RepID=A0ABR5AA86_9BACL|nr:hypothetical protein [Paenibacillus sp. VKM B-2647]KIL37966.1 hypothetical protein SD70_29730 [Paenibacillus sp. VKM B-2647]
MMTEDEKALLELGVKFHRKQMSGIIAGFYVCTMARKHVVINELLEESHFRIVCKMLLSMLTLSPDLPHYVFEATAVTAASE